jgi:NAD(P)H-quinone oxidoreductase subunit 4
MAPDDIFKINESMILLYFSFLIVYLVFLSNCQSLHTWLSDAHGEAHYNTCMLLA